MTSRPGFQRSAEVARRREQVLALRLAHRPDSEIAATLGITIQLVRVDYKRALEDYAAQQAETAHVARDRELAKLDLMEQAVHVVLNRLHVTVSNGKLIYLNDKPLEDDAPILSAVDRLVRIADRRAKLLGMDAPARIEVSDATDQAIRALAAELAAGVGDMEPGGTAETARGAEAGEVRAPAT